MATASRPARAALQRKTLNLFRFVRAQEQDWLLVYLLPAAARPPGDATSDPRLWMRTAALLLRLACAYGMAVSSINRAKLSSTTVSLAEVLSTCVDAASRGCAEISAVQSRRAAGGELSVAMKDQADVRSALTEADLAAQRVMVGALRSAWPGLVIVGEEDEDESAGAADEVTGPPLRRDLCAELGVPGLEAPLEELCVFVDPLDGTREFVEGRLENVQSLVGLARF